MSLMVEGLTNTSAITTGIRGLAGGTRGIIGISTGSESEPVVP